MAKRFDKRQVDELKLAFEDSQHLTKAKKLELARVTGLDMEQVTSWFNRMRARKRARESMRNLKQINAGLRRSLQECQESEARLRKELEESRMREAKVGSEEQNLKCPTGIAEGDVHHDLLSYFKDHMNEIYLSILLRESAAPF